MLMQQISVTHFEGCYEAQTNESKIGKGWPSQDTQDIHLIHLWKRQLKSSDASGKLFPAKKRKYKCHCIKHF